LKTNIARRAPGKAPVVNGDSRPQTAQPARLDGGRQTAPRRARSPSGATPKPLAAPERKTIKILTRRVRAFSQRLRPHTDIVDN